MKTSVGKYNSDYGANRLATCDILMKGSALKDVEFYYRGGCALPFLPSKKGTLTLAENSDPGADWIQLQFKGSSRIAGALLDKNTGQVLEVKTPDGTCLSFSASDLNDPGRLVSISVPTGNYVDVCKPGNQAPAENFLRYVDSALQAAKHTETTKKS